MIDTVIAADLHIKRRPDEQYALQQIVDHAIRLNARQVLLLGDLLDKQTNRAEPSVAWHKAIERLEKAGIAVLFIQGNHDYDTPPWLSAHAWAQHVHKKEFTVGPFQAYGLDFCPFGVLQEELAKIPTNSLVLACHQGWGEWISFDGAPQGDFGQVPDNIEVLLAGDLHQFKMETHKNAGGSDMLTVSPGAGAAQKIDEPHEHFVVTCDTEGNFKKLPLRSRPFWDSPLLLRPADLEELLADVDRVIVSLHESGEMSELPPEMTKPVFRITYSHKLPDVVRRVERAVNDRADLFFYETPPEVGETAGLTTTAKEGEAVTPLSCLDDELSKHEEPAAYSLVQRLLAAQDQDAEILRWRAEFMETV